MKKFILPVLFLVIWLAPSPAGAELVFYKGTRNEVYTGEGRTLTAHWRMRVGG